MAQEYESYCDKNPNMKSRCPSSYFSQIIILFPVYVDASEMCNDLVFQLGTNGNGATIMPRAWNIKVPKYCSLRFETLVRSKL